MEQIGEIVRVIVDPATNNGSDVAVAIVTKASGNFVNLRVVLESATTLPYMQNVPFFETESEARAMLPTYAAFCHVDKTVVYNKQLDLYQEAA